jgi:hypothetical protein
VCDCDDVLAICPWWCFHDLICLLDGMTDSLTYGLGLPKIFFFRPKALRPKNNHIKPTVNTVVQKKTRKKPLIYTTIISSNILLFSLECAPCTFFDFVRNFDISRGNHYDPCQKV